MPLKTNKQVLLLKIESAFNVDATPTAIADAIQCEEPEFTIDPVVLERNYIKPTWDRNAHAVGRKLAKVSFTTEIKSSGTRTVQSKLGRMLTACGMKEVYDSTLNSEKYTYTPSSVEADHKSATIHLYKDGNLHILTGCFGTVSFEGAVNGYGKATFEFTGQYYAPTAAALPLNPTFETSKPAQVELAQFTIDGYGAVISKFTLDMGVEVLPRLDANGTDGYNGTYIGDRSPSGGIDPEAVLVSSHNFWTKFASAAEMALNFRFGTVAGNTVTFSAPKCQYSGMTYSSRDRMQTHDAALTFNGNTGDDEVKIEFA